MVKVVFQCGLFSVLGLLTLTNLQALDRTWIGGNVDWVDAGSTANWTPADEPDADDRAIFNTANTVNLGSNNAVNGLALSAGIDLFTNDFDLTVDGLVEAAGASTNLFIEGAAGSIDADDVTINADGTIELRGGTLTLDEEVGTSLIDINVGGNLIGNGTISFADVPGAVTTVLINDGELTALSRGLTIFSPPPVGTLSINAPNAGGLGRVDLDGAGEAGVVNVNRNQTLDFNAGFADFLNGTMNLFQESTFDSLNAWTLAGGSIIANNGFIDGIFPNPDVPAGTSFIEGGLLTQTGGTINVVDTDGTLQLDSNFTMSGGTFTNSGTTIFNGTTTITTAAGYAPTLSSADTIINGAMTITDVAGDFNWDGPGTATTTINGAGSLSLTVDQVDTGNDLFGGDLNLNDGGDLSVNNTANTWTLAGTLNKNGASVSTISGEALNVTGTINAGGTGTLDLPLTTLSSSANVDITSRLTLGGGSVLAGPATLTGTGELEMEGTSTVTVNTTVNVATFDWDGAGSGTTQTISAGATLTINSPTFDSDGDMDDPISLGGSGSQLIVNGPTQWTMNQAINANNAGVGTATIGGTSRLILTGANADLNVNGNTQIAAPVTFDAGSTTSIDAGFFLDGDAATTYSGGTITGLGTYFPGVTNTVTANSSITVSTFDFDAGTWTVDPGATLTVNVTDYDTTVTNAFDATITLNNGDVSVFTSDAEFVMDGTLNFNSTAGNISFWTGEPVQIGNDAGALDADVNVTGDFISSVSQFASPVTFNSDADVNIPFGGALQFATASTVTFNTVNGPNNAEFTGDGRIEFNGGVNVNEAVTLNMVGGVVNLDGTDLVGEFINIDAPLTINVEFMSSFGKVNGVGVNTLDVNNSVGTGVLTVNLDNAADEWTLNGPGVMNLVNDNVEATLLAGNDVNINGTLNVTGDVRTTARLDIGSTGVVNINTAGQPLRLAGGDTTDFSTINGGTINGPGLLGADTDKALRGFGTINANIDFDGTANLLADNGVLTLNGAILDVNVLGTADADGVLNIPAAWNTSTGSGAGIIADVQLLGGTLQGGTITNDNGSGIQGIGTVTSRVINNTRLLAGNGGGTLVIQTAANDNDWDGAANTGELIANASATLELRDVGAAFGFTGTVTASPGGRVFTNGFALDFNPGSTLHLANGTYESTSGTNIGGTVTIDAGAESTIKSGNADFLTFEAPSTTTLNGNLRLQSPNGKIEAGATFSGTGALIVPDGSALVADPGANIGVLLVNQGRFDPGGLTGVGIVDVDNFQQTATGDYFSEIGGALLNQLDRLDVVGVAALDGRLVVDLDNLFNPALGSTFDIITAASVSGAFHTVDYEPLSLPVGKTFHVDYLATAVRLTVVNTPFFSADFDDDGDVDPTDLAIWQGAYGLNQLGDADGDNDSDGRDFMAWQRQFGSAPLVAVSTANSTAVPEPTTGVFISVALILSLSWRKI